MESLTWFCLPMCVLFFIMTTCDHWSVTCYFGCHYIFLILNVLWFHCIHVFKKSQNCPPLLSCNGLKLQICVLFSLDLVVRLLWIHTLDFNTWHIFQNSLHVKNTRGFIELPSMYFTRAIKSFLSVYGYYCISIYDSWMPNWLVTLANNAEITIVQVLLWGDSALMLTFTLFKSFSAVWHSSWPWPLCNWPWPFSIHRRRGWPPRIWA